MPVNLDTLYNIYNANKLVFIVGSELLRLARKEQTFEQYVIERIAGKTVDPAKRPRTYVDLAIKYADDVDENVIQGIFNTTRGEGFNKKLLELVTDFPNIGLFITTTFDSELQELLGDNTEEVIWNHRKNEPLYLNLANNKRKVVYLFGKFDHGVSLFEEEQLECLLSLASYNEKSRSVSQDRYSFLEYLKDKTLVFIGVNSSDWFLRLLIRTLYNAPVTPKPNKAYIINDKTSSISFERYFFEKFRIELIHEYPIEEWLNEARERIRERDLFDDWYKPRQVFISYDRTDKETADKIKKSLNLKHIKAFLDTEDMGIANHEKKIKGLIQSTDTCLFLCVLSGTLAAKSKQDSYVKRIEWKNASDRCIANNYLSDSGQTPAPFVIASYAIDDFNNYRDNLDDFITANNILPGATKSIDDLCELVEKEVKSVL